MFLNDNEAIFNNYILDVKINLRVQSVSMTYLVDVTYVLSVKKIYRICMFILSSIYS
jgi:hypothetical protein